MDYPSTTQALFALIVMTIVLAFILVYCCWGTFSCPRPEAIPCSDDRDSLSVGRDRSNSSTPPAFFILPYRNMIYVGDGRTQRVFQIPINDDKPPSYTELFASASPPDYSSFSVPNLGAPPTYEQCFRYGNSAVMIEDSRNNSQTNTENDPSNAQFILSASEFHRSSSSLRDSSVSGVSPVQSSNPKLFAAPSLIKNWGKRTSLGHNSQSTYLPPSLFKLQSNSCYSNPCSPTIAPLFGQSSHLESLHSFDVYSSHMEISDLGKMEDSEEGCDVSLTSKAPSDEPSNDCNN